MLRMRTFIELLLLGGAIVLGMGLGEFLAHHICASAGGGR